MRKIPRDAPVEAAASRKGAMRMAEIPKSTLDGLNRGELEAVTLVEMLSVHHGKLLRAVAADAPKQLHQAMDDVMTLKITGRMKQAGSILLTYFGLDEGLRRCLAHRSDTVRAWAAFMVGEAEGLSLSDRLSRIAVLADDPNAGTREWAWLALRKHIDAELLKAIKLLTRWTQDPSPNIRRFASEATRPRGVWCAHLPLLKKEPSLGLPILEPLHNDDAKYVQNSVANWINDAGKSQPEFARELCREWRARSPGKSTARICQRALRSLTE
jgi:3-methyladenine DNA glycosylase AlkC